MRLRQCAQEYRLKSLNIESEAAKATYWKAIDRRRMGWWGVVSRKIKPLYEKEAREVVKVIKGKDNPENMEAAASRAIKKLGPEWEKTLTAVLLTLIEDFGKRTAEDLGAQKSESKWTFDPFSIAARLWMAQHGAELVRTISATNLADVRTVILKGKQQNLLMPQIAQNIKGFYADQNSYKAMRVARTEVSAAAGYGQREAAKQSGVAKGKKWMTSRDSRVRDAHMVMDGEERMLDERYSNGLMYPGDSGGGAAQSIQCRCVEQYLSRKPKVPSIGPRGEVPLNTIGRVDKKSIGNVKSALDDLPSKSKSGISEVILNEKEGPLIGRGPFGPITSAGHYNPKTGIINLYEAGSAFPKGEAQWIIGHEVGHNVYANLPVDKLAKFIAATNKEKGVSGYAKAWLRKKDKLAGYHENFAETHKIFSLTEDSSYILELMRKNPETYAAFKNIWTEELGGKIWWQE